MQPYLVDYLVDGGFITSRGFNLSEDLRLAKNAKTRRREKATGCTWCHSCSGSLAATPIEEAVPPIVEKVARQLHKPRK